MKKLLSVLAFTILISALFHLAFVGVMAFLKRDISYINPLDFLGLTIAMPQYRDSRAATTIGWVVLAVLFFVLYYFYSHFRVYVSFIHRHNVIKFVIGACLTKSQRKKSMRE